MTTSNSRTICTGLWRWLQGTGLERFEMIRASDEWIFQGTILASAGAAAAEARYEITSDNSFQTRKAEISVVDPMGQRTINIVSQSGRWYVNGAENLKVRGSVDIDLGWSPSTNTLPIRRLNLEVGQSSGEIIAAWVSFPELALQPLPQEYCRVTENEYRYSSQGGAFVAKLDVDEHGVVVNYQGFWERVAEKQ